MRSRLCRLLLAALVVASMSAPMRAQDNSFALAWDQYGYPPEIGNYTFNLYLVVNGQLGGPFPVAASCSGTVSPMVCKMTNKVGPVAGPLDFWVSLTAVYNGEESDKSAPVLVRCNAACTIVLAAPGNVRIIP